MRFSCGFGTRFSTAHVLSTLMAAGLLSACGASGGTDATNTSDALKGGISAKGQEKSNNGKHVGQAGGVAPGQDEAGSAADDGNGHGPKAEAGAAAPEEHGNSSGKAKGPKAEAGAAAPEEHGNSSGKAKGPKAGAGGHGHADGDDAADEGSAGAGGDGDESADEST